MTNSIILMTVCADRMSRMASDHPCKHIKQ